MELSIIQMAFIVFLLVSLLLGLSYRIAIGLGLILLTLSVYNLSYTQFTFEVITAVRLSEYAYYLLAIGVIQRIAEMVMKDMGLIFYVRQYLMRREARLKSKMTSKMKICFITGFPPIGGSGAETTKKLVDALANSDKVEHIYVLGNYKFKPFNESQRGVSILRVWKYESIMNFYRLFRGVLKVKPHIVHLEHGYFFYGRSILSVFTPVLILFFLKLVKIRRIVTFHSVISLRSVNKDFAEKWVISKYPPPLILRLGLLFLVKSIVSLCEKSIALSKREADILRVEYGARPERVACIPIGVEKCELLPRSAAAKEIKMEGEHVILHFGFIAPYKGIEDLIRAFHIVLRRLPDSVLIVAGDLPPRLRYTETGVNYLARLRSLIHALGVDSNVKFVQKYIPENEVKYYFSVADVVVLPYVCQLSISGVLRLAFEYNVPVVTSNSEYFRTEEMNGRTGLLFPIGDINKLAQMIIILLTDKQFREKIRRNIDQVAKQMSWRNIADATLEVYSGS